MLESKEQSRKGLCLVAHPDDCVIFAQAFIEEYKNINWTIVYLTYDLASDRGKEIASYWDTLNIKTIFLGFQDNIVHNEEVVVLNKLTNLGLDIDLILTHNPMGEYGHIHHLLMHNVAQKLPQPKIYFGNGFVHNYQSPVPNDPYPHLPLHNEVISKFTIEDRCKYFFDEKVNQIL
jgi:LmbE family N-acetylglucosaminyl deacetylase